MTQPKKQRHFQNRKGPFYSIGKVKKLAKEKKGYITETALSDAWRDFSWGHEDILSAIKKLQVKNWYKTAQSILHNKIPIDVYKACGLMNEDVYMHFYIDFEEKLLVVESFKRI